jgi:N-acyl-D-amino-acid deacylase
MIPPHGSGLSKNVAMSVRAVAALAFTLFSAALLQSSQAPRAFDVLIRNGRVVDGTGAPGRLADVGIAGGRIAAVGTLGDAQGATVIDATGLTVTPGFIDVHSHAAAGLNGDLRTAHQLLAQGLTTVVLNPDGGGPIDLRAQRSAYERAGIGVNVALYVPHGSIRREVLGMADRAPTAAELDRMIALVRDGMAAGGIGLSSGIYYAPGSYAKIDEVIAMAKAAGEAGGVYESHIRDEADYNIGVVAAVDEVIRVAEEAHLPGIVAHMKALGPASWGLSSTLVAHIQQARDRGVQVWDDQYPYDASGTSIVGALIPRWAEVGGRQELLKRIDGRDRERLLDDVRKNFARRGGPDKLIVSFYTPNRALEGQSIAEIARAMRRPPAEAVLDLLEKGDASLVSFNMSEEDIARIMRQPFTMTCTDGDLVAFGNGKPHPRGNGAFARKIRVYVEEQKTIDLPFAIRSMTSLPANVYGMKDRGLLRPGAWADVLVFDPTKVRDAATYQNPHQLAEGMTAVLVNGVIVKRDAAWTDKLAGRIVTPQR